MKTQTLFSNFQILMFLFDFTVIDYSIVCIDTQKSLHQHGVHQLEKREAGKLNKRCLALEMNLKTFKAKAKRDIKRENHQIFKPINDILYSWFKKCEASGIYINGHLLKEEAMNITQSL